MNGKNNPNRKPGDRPLPDGSKNYNPDGTLRDLDAENPSQAEKMRLGYPEDMPADKEADVTDEAPADAPPSGEVGPEDHGHSGDAPGHTGGPNPGHGGTPPGQTGGSPGKSGQAPGHGGEGHGKTKGHDK